MRRAKPGGWYDDFRYRIGFEGEARRAFGSMQVSRTGKGRKSGAVVYTLHVTVPAFEEQRLIRITLRNWTRPSVRAVTADGPSDSPHRYSEAELCMWYPSDGPELTWEPQEGLLALIQYTAIHLFREAYWRRYSEWPGPQAPHDVGEAQRAA